VTKPVRTRSLSKGNSKCALHPGPHPRQAKLAAEQLILTKQTNREKDYAAIGELARLLDDPLAVLRYSRSARDILEIAARHPDVLAAARIERPCLAAVGQGREALAAAPDAERRLLMARNEERLEHFEQAARPWASLRPALSREIAGWPLRQAHERVIEAANGCLPTTVPGIELT
jgi:hypothetical protein